MTIIPTLEIEAASTEQARQQGTTPERLALDGLQNLFLMSNPTPGEILEMAAQVYAGLPAQDVSDVEKIALDRSRFAGQKHFVSFDTGGFFVARGIIKSKRVTTMAETLTLEPITEEDVQHKAQIEQYLREMKRLNSEMAADQPSLDTLKIETRMLASETRSILSDIWATIARIEAI